MHSTAQTYAPPVKHPMGRLTLAILALDVVVFAHIVKAICRFIVT